MNDKELEYRCDSCGNYFGWTPTISWFKDPEGGDYPGYYFCSNGCKEEFYNGRVL